MKKESTPKNDVSAVRRAKHGGVLTVIFAILCFVWVSPMLVVLMNSFKKKAYIFRNPLKRKSVGSPRQPLYSLTLNTSRANRSR